MCSNLLIQHGTCPYGDQRLPFLHQDVELLGVHDGGRQKDGLCDEWEYGHPQDIGHKMQWIDLRSFFNQLPDEYGILDERPDLHLAGKLNGVIP